MAITVNEQGQVLQNGQWVTTNQSDEFKAAIDKAKQEGAVVGENATFAIVEKGDWLLKIADQYGANGRQLAYTDNKQFADNPDLIYEGEAVVVNGGNPAAGDEPGNPLSGTPTGASSAALPNPQGYQQMKTVLSNKESTSAQRQAALEAYLAPLTPEQRQAAVKQLDADLDTDRVLGPVFKRDEIDGDIQAVVQKLSAPTYEETRAVLADPASSSATRQTALEAYLGSLKPEEVQGAVTRLKADLDIGETSMTQYDRGAIASDIDAVVQKLDDSAGS